MLTFRLFFVPLLLTSCSAESNLLLVTSQGQVKGQRRTVAFDLANSLGQVDVYRRIPYAEPPLGENRFKRPVTVVEQPGVVINEGEKNVICSQSRHWFVEVVPSSRTGVQNEDCLYLSVYTPVNPSAESANYPVLVYIHGGSYQVGGNVYYDGSVLASIRTVVVVINYRLGPFGFLGDGSAEFPGNVGIYDQIESLRWVQKYISAYRGDPKRVTVMGHSAGGWSAGIHVLSPLSKDLFHNVIIQSGSILSKLAWQTEESLKFTFDAVKNVLGCEEDVRVCLLNATAGDILDIAGFVTSVPWVDGQLLTDTPQNMLSKKEVNDVRVLLGTTKDEWARFITLMNGTVPDKWLIPSMDNDPSMDVREAIHEGIITGMEFNDINDYTMAVVKLIRYLYTNASQELDSISNRDLFLSIFTDYFTLAPTVRLATALTNSGLQVHVYSFADTLPVNAPGVEHYAWLGAFSYHEVDIPFSFGAPFTGENMRETWFVGKYGETDRNISTLQMGVISAMCHYRSPVTPKYVQQTWKPYTAKEESFAVLSRGKIIQRFKHKSKRMEFWNEIYPVLEAREPIEPVIEESVEETVGDPQTALPARSGFLEMWVLYICISVIVVLMLVISMLAFCTLKKRLTQGAA